MILYNYSLFVVYVNISFYITSYTNINVGTY